MHTAVRWTDQSEPPTTMKTTPMWTRAARGAHLRQRACRWSATASSQTTRRQPSSLHSTASSCSTPWQRAAASVATSRRQLVSCTRRCSPLLTGTTGGCRPGSDVMSVYRKVIYRVEQKNGLLATVRQNILKYPQSPSMPQIRACSLCALQMFLSID